MAKALRRSGLISPSIWNGSMIFDGRAGRIQVERLAQTVNGIDVHPRHRGCAQVERNAVRFLVLQGEANSLT